MYCEFRTSTGTAKDEDNGDLGVIEDGHWCSLLGSSRDDAVRGARGFSERREDWESGWVFARCFVMRTKEPKEATMRPRNTSGLGPF